MSQRNHHYRKLRARVRLFQQRLSVVLVRRLAFMAIAGILALFTIVLTDSRHDVREKAMAAARSVNIAVAKDIGRNFEIIDLSLQAAVEGYRNALVMGLDPMIRDMVLFDRAIRARNLGAVVIADGSGRVILDSRFSPPRNGVPQLAEAFARHRDHADPGPFVSAPFTSRADGRATISLTRRINDEAGAFAGIAAATIKADYLHQLYDGIDIGRRGEIALWRADGQALFRRIAETGESAVSRKQIEALSDEASGWIEIETPEGARKLAYFERVEGFPLIQFMILDLDDVYGAWWRKTGWLAGLMTLLCGFILGLNALLHREIQQRKQLEKMLEQLAMSDSLTGLANRRAFDEALAREFRRATRSRLTLSVMLIDIDHFKRFNDTYGHPAADSVLVSLAQEIQGAINRPGDLAARYGGEEFILLLPDTDTQGARLVGQRIQDRLAALRVAHSGSPGGRLTVSIGIASLTPREGQNAANLVAAADEALYMAKSSGRNRVVTHKTLMVAAAA